MAPKGGIQIERHNRIETFESSNARIPAAIVPVAPKTNRAPKREMARESENIASGPQEVLDRSHICLLGQRRHVADRHVVDHALPERRYFLSD
jgi:hypothetical protein